MIRNILAFHLDQKIFEISRISDLEIPVVDRVKKKSLQIKKQLATWLKEQACHYITTKLPLLVTQTGLTPISFKIRLYKARWGSCNNKGELSFNYLLMMAPLWVVDYVIIHELCHLKHLNHSNKFWQLVDQYYPNYKDAQLWLKKHQSQLTW